MALSRRSIVTLCGTVGGTMLLAALAMSPAAAGGRPAAGSPAGGAVPAATLPSGGCVADAHVETQWGSGTTGGEIVTVTVTNTSSVTATKWTVTWTLGAGQQIVSAWNAGVTTSDGAATAV